MMYAVTGITGQVGGAVAETLLARGQRVRAVVRDEARGAAWRDRGCEIAVVADASDVRAFTSALQGTQGVFLMNPPNYDPEPGFPDTRRVASAFAEALDQARPERAIFLSTVGAQSTRFNLLNNGGIVEEALRQTPVPVAFLRAAWFIENASWDLPSARQGRIESYLGPADRGIDMVSAKDVGRVAAELLEERWTGVRIVELKGLTKISPRDLAGAFSRALGTAVEVDVIPRETWEERFRAEGMANPEARIAMLEGFNEGWIDFEGGGAEQRIGFTPLDEAVAAVITNRP